MCFSFRAANLAATHCIFTNEVCTNVLCKMFFVLMVKMPFEQMCTNVLCTNELYVTIYKCTM